MPLSHRRYLNDEELGKRDDDRKPRTRPPSYSAAVFSSPLRRRRLVMVVLFFIFCLAFFRITSNLRKVDDDHIPKPPFKFRDILPVGLEDISRRRPPHSDNDDSEIPSHYFNGPINFYRLAVSLQGASRTMGYRSRNRNVLFVAGSLKSAASLIPLACEMARWRRSDVHFAFMGRNDVSLNDILKVNGVVGQCDVTWHGKCLLAWS